MSSNASLQPTAVPQEPLWQTWIRRLVTLPGYFVLCAAAVCLFPLLIAGAVVADLLLGGPWVVVRCMTFFTFYLCCEVIGIKVSCAVWLVSGVWMGRGTERFQRWNFQLECWWARTLLRGASLIFGMRTTVETAADLSRGPILLFIRHASVGDTLLPAVLVSHRHQIVLRYVLKRELLWDPCLDIVGNRLLNHFARRGSGDSEREIAAVQRLLDNLGPRDGVLIYPEGTRFTPAKQQRALARIAEGANATLLAKARALTHVLPPRLGGPLGLLERNPGADAVFCAHTGFEEAGTFNDLLKGPLVGAVIRVAFWRVPFAEIPTQRADQIEWLYDQWLRVDRWVAANQSQAHPNPEKM